MASIPGVVPQNPASEQHCPSAQFPIPGPQVSDMIAAGGGLAPIVSLIQLPNSSWQPKESEQKSTVEPQNPFTEQHGKEVGH